MQQIEMATATRATRARRWANRVLWSGAGLWWALRRPHTRGVKLVLHGDLGILFVRHAYGDRNVWELPGGGRRRDESAAQAASREAREELGIEVDDWDDFGEFEDRDRATAHLRCMGAEYDGSPLRFAQDEIREACWARPGDPPAPLGRLAARALALAADSGRGVSGP